MVVGGTSATAYLTCDMLKSLSGGRFTDCHTMTLDGDTKASDVTDNIGNREQPEVVVAVCDEGAGAESVVSSLRRDGWDVKTFTDIDGLEAIAQGNQESPA